MKKVLFFGGYSCPFSLEAQKHLINLGYDVTCDWSYRRGQKVSKKTFDWKGDLIISFLNYIILPKNILKKAPAVNFHPGPPEHPGSGCVSWAMYENQKIYGVTVHELTAKVDSGKIFKVNRFDISNYELREDIDYRVKTELLKLFYEYFEYTNWPRDARMINEIDEISNLTSTYELDTDEHYAEVDRRIKSFHTKQNPVYVIIGNKKFEYVSES